MEPVRTYIVEDSPIIRENLIATLEEMTAVEVIGCAEDEDTAIEWLTRPGNVCELIVIDIFLKTGSGLRVLARARHAGIAGKRVVLTNYANQSLRRLCHRLGAHRVFDKSGEVDELIAYCARIAQDRDDTPPGDVND